MVPEDLSRYYAGLYAYVAALPKYNHRISMSMQKLGKFSIVHLTELSCDIFDEINRRRDLPHSGHLPPRKDIHQKRNNARFQFGDLSVQRFGDMCRDVIAELERRFPDLAAGSHGSGVPEPVPEIPPLHRTRTLRSAKPAASSEFLSVTEPGQSAAQAQAQAVATKQTEVVPTKSTMVMEESDSDPEYESWNKSDQGATTRQPYSVDSPVVPESAYSLSFRDSPRDSPREPSIRDSGQSGQSGQSGSARHAPSRSVASAVQGPSSAVQSTPRAPAAESAHNSYDTPHDWSFDNDADTSNLSALEKRLAASTNLGLSANNDFHFGVEEQLIDSRSSRMPPGAGGHYLDTETPTLDPASPRAVQSTLEPAGGQAAGVQPRSHDLMHDLDELNEPSGGQGHSHSHSIHDFERQAHTQAPTQIHDALGIRTGSFDNSLGSRGSFDSLKRRSLGEPEQEFEHSGEHAAQTPTLAVQNSTPRASDILSSPRSYVSGEEIHDSVHSSPGLVEYSSHLEDQVRELEQLNAEVVKENEQLHNMLADTENERKQLEERVGDATLVEPDAETLRQELATLQQEYARVVAESQNRSEQEPQSRELDSQLETEHGALRDAHSDLQESHRALDESHQLLKSGHDDISARHAQLLESHEQLKQENEELRAQLEALRAQHTELQGTHSALEDQHSALGQQHSELQGVHSELNEAHTSLQGTLATLKDEHSALHDTHMALVDQHTTLQERSLDEPAARPLSEHGQAQLSALQAQHTTLQTQHAALQEDHRNFKDEYGTLQGAFQHLQTQYANLQNEQVEPKGLNIQMEDYTTLLSQHKTLLNELEDQRRVTDQVRQEAQRMLGEMRTMTKTSLPFTELQKQLAAAKAEAQHWRTISASKPSARVRDRESIVASPALVYDPQGLVDNIEVLKFQDNIENLLSTRSMDSLHLVISSVERILGFISADDTTFAKQTRLVMRTANQLISATRNSAEQGLLFHRSIVTAACSDLSFAMCEFLKDAKVKPSEFLAPSAKESMDSLPQVPQMQKVKEVSHQQVPKEIMVGERKELVGPGSVGSVSSVSASGSAGPSSTGSGAPASAGTLTARDSVASLASSSRAHGSFGSLASGSTVTAVAASVSAGSAVAGSTVGSTSGSAPSSAPPSLPNSAGVGSAGASASRRRSSGKYSSAFDLDEIETASRASRSSLGSRVSVIDEATAAPVPTAVRNSMHSPVRTSVQSSRSPVRESRVSHGSLGSPARPVPTLVVPESPKETAKDSAKSSPQTSPSRLSIPPVPIPVDSTVAELQAYLEEQTSETVDSIRELLSGIKADLQVAELRPLVDSIVYYVDLMVRTTGACMDRTEHWLLKDKGAFILQNLDDCCRRMAALRGNLDEFQDDDAAPRPLKQRLAGVSFDMAKCTKELVKTVEDVSLKSEIETLDQRMGRA